MAGLIILIERPIKVGDIVDVGRVSGRVLDIRVRSTIIQTRDNITIIVPNSKFVAEEVTNDSYLGQKIRLHVRVRVPHDADLQKVRGLLCQAAGSHEKVFKDPAPIVVFEDFGDSALQFDVRFWCDDIWHLERISSEIRFEIARLFRENGIIIPVNQHNVHMVEDAPVPFKS